MVKINGYTRMFRKVKLIDNPAISLLSIFIEMATEEEYQNAKSFKLEVHMSYITRSNKHNSKTS